MSQWADQERVLSPESSAEPGRWNTARVAYLREILDAVSDPAVHTVVCEKGAQVGWTEVINNVVGYFIHQEPSSILAVQPTSKLAETWSKKRLTPMLRDTPALRDKVRDPKSRDSDNTILEKSFPGGYLAAVGANTPNDLSSRPLRVVVADEVDKYPANVAGFGDPLALARSRQNTFWNRKTLIGSTPGELRTSVVHHWFLRGDQRHYLMPCPHCEHEQRMEWERIVWDTDEEGHHPETAAYHCVECGALWTEAQRLRAISLGRWEATKPFNGIASFHLPGFLSPWLTLAEIAGQFLEAKDYAPRLRQWINEVKGEPWEDRGEATDPGKLADRLEAYDETSLPDRVRLVTAGVDTQDDRLEVTFTGWGDGEEAWVISHEIILGDPGGLEPWTILDQRLREAEFLTEGGRRLRVRATCIDSGGHKGSMVLGFCRTRAARHIYATKGMGNDYRGSKPIWAKTILNTKNAGDRLWAVGVDTGKDDLAARLRIVPKNEATPRAVHFPAVGLPVGYFDQLTAEQVVTELNSEGRRVRRWKLKPGRERNEALDCFILSHAAMLSLGVRLMPGLARGRVPVSAEEAAAEIPLDSDAELRQIATEAPDTVPAPSSVLTEPASAMRRRRDRWKAYGL